MPADNLEGLRHEVAETKQLLRAAKAAQYGVMTVDVEFDEEEMRARPKPGARRKDYTSTPRQ